MSSTTSSKGPMSRRATTSRTCTLCAKPAFARHAASHVTVALCGAKLMRQIATSPPSSGRTHTCWQASACGFMAWMETSMSKAGTVSRRSGTSSPTRKRRDLQHHHSLLRGPSMGCVSTGSCTPGGDGDGGAAASTRSARTSETCETIPTTRKVQSATVHMRATSCGMVHGAIHQLSRGVKGGQLDQTGSPCTPSGSWLMRITSSFE
mmetsp:Transcript_6659/g.17357  ORF Transcript_6659/g.17357 Transcript_6659/m.17357 type:complete len:207 (+) Transcript_6659:266-886(+)